MDSNTVVHRIFVPSLLDTILAPHNLWQYVSALRHIIIIFLKSNLTKRNQQMTQYITSTSPYTKHNQSQTNKVMIQFLNAIMEQLLYICLITRRITPISLHIFVHSPLQQNRSWIFPQHFQWRFHSMKRLPICSLSVNCSMSQRCLKSTRKSK